MADILSMIKKEQLIDDDLFKTLFCENGEEPSRIPVTAVPKLMFNICVFYADLMQMMLINKAMMEDRELAEVCSDSKIFNFMNGMWTAEHYDIAEDSSVFSFIEDIASNRIMPSAFGDEAQANISKARNYYRGLIENKKQWDVQDIKRCCMGLIEDFRLFRKIRFDPENNTATVDGVRLNTLPFFTFKNGSIRMATSIGKGHSNNHFRVSMMPFNSPNHDIQKEQVSISARNDEYLKMLCTKLGISTEWYDQEEYLGSCTFVVRLAHILSCTVCQYIVEVMTVPENITGSVKMIYTDSPMESTLKNVKTKINIKGASADNEYALQNLFIGLIITYGAFNVTYHFFVNKTEKTNRDRDRNISYSIDNGRLFEIALENIRVYKYLKTDEESCVNRYRNEIEDHISQLRHIVTPESDAYVIRSEQIKGEHMASCLMELIGIEAENLFIDQESLLSIYDYFDMMISRNADIPSIIRRVVSFLIKFYSKMTGVTATVSSDMSPAETIEVFSKFCEETMKIPVCRNGGDPGLKRNPEDVIGRSICDPEHLKLYINNFRHVGSWNSENLNLKTKKFFFISYAHDEMDIALECAMECRKNGYNVYIDKEKFGSGDDWQAKAQTALADENCCGVLAFLSRDSVTRDTIKFELTQAHNTAKQKMDSGVLTREEYDSFIIPVNMEKEPIKTWMSEILAVTDKEDVDEGWKNALDISDTGILRQLYCRSGVMGDILAEVKKHVIGSGTVVSYESLNAAEAALGSFLTFLIDGTYHWFDSDNISEMKKIVNDSSSYTYNCIYPMLLSVKETRIKRDKVTIIGYEILNGKGKNKTENRVMLSSRNLPTNDYYCIPNIHSCGECGEWMANPYLVSSDELRDMQ